MIENDQSVVQQPPELVVQQPEQAVQQPEQLPAPPGSAHFWAAVVGETYRTWQRLHSFQHQLVDQFPHSWTAVWRPLVPRISIGGEPRAAPRAIMSPRPSDLSPATVATDEVLATPRRDAAGTGGGILKPVRPNAGARVCSGPAGTTYPATLTPADLLRQQNSNQLYGKNGENGQLGMKNNDYLRVKQIPELVVTKSSDANDDENKERGNWSNKMEFLLSCLSYAVGLGNIWRFPYLCYSNGGGAFLIPYMIMIFVAGLPLFFLELAFGQYASEGPVTIWKISPLFQGIGYGMFLVSFFVGIYYNMIVAWTFFYLFSSFTSELPWSACDNWWNTEACRRFDTKNCTSHAGVMLLNGTCIFKEMVGEADFKNISDTVKMKMPSDEYFHNYMLEISEGIHDLGTVKWQLTLCLLLSWILVYVALIKGVKSFGKLVYFTAFFPYIVMTILLIRAATLPGYLDGIMFYITPQWHRLKEAKVWGDAAIQIFFSLSPCWGGLVTLASYNQFHNNCFRDAMIVGIINPLTSVYAGFVLFGIVGFMAHELGVPVEEVSAQGAGLAFIAYPEAVTRLPISPLWAILFFVMLLTLGLGTQFTILETVVTTIVDSFPQQLRKQKKWVLAAVSFIMFCLGLVLCTRGGVYMLQLMDAFAASYSTLLIGLIELIVIAWVYGVDRFMNDIKVMLGHYPFHPLYWRWCWKFVTPAVLIFILIFTWIDFKGITYGDYVFPTWSLCLGWMLSMFSVLVIPSIAAYKVYHHPGPTIWMRIKDLSKPTSEWGPKLQVHRSETDRPKHIDSQVPLAASQDCDGMDDDMYNGDALGNGDADADDGEGLKFKFNMEVVDETGL